MRHGRRRRRGIRGGAPVFVYQGVRDPVTPQHEADQIVAALRRRGIPVEYMLIANEGHGVTRRENLIAYLAGRIASSRSTSRSRDDGAQSVKAASEGRICSTARLAVHEFGYRDPTVGASRC